MDKNDVVPVKNPVQGPADGAFAPEIDYPTFYDEQMKDICTDLDISEEIQTVLAQKREFGLNKYKERSFQGSFDSSMRAQGLYHLEEELVDSFNYAIHSIYQFRVMGKQHQISLMTDVVSHLKEAMNLLEILKGNK